MKLLPSAVLFVAIALVASAQEDEKWQLINVKDGACSIEFPGKPIDPGKLGEDKKGGQQLILEVLDGKAVYMLQFNLFQNPIPIDQADAVKRIFDGGQGGLTNALKGKILKSDDGKFGPYPIRDIEMEVPSLGIYKVRFVLSANRFYQVTAVGPEEFTSGKDVARFMKSFKITKD
jgi:hypothetical protein